tara:strand:+ start:506 stop:700 length:195 start_codon:yes stop_codon:yes gene_type:complete
MNCNPNNLANAGRKATKETETDRQERHAKIEDLYLCIDKLVKCGYKDLAFVLRSEADKLRIYWK